MNKHLNNTLTGARRGLGFLQSKATAILAVVALFFVAGIEQAAAQGPANAGVTEIVNAIDALKPDMSFVVVAGVTFALIGIGAVAALALVKRLMGK